MSQLPGLRSPGLQSTGLAVLVALCLVLGLAGCGGLLKSDAPLVTEWWLVPTQLTTPAAGPALPLLLDLDVVPGLNTDRVLNLGDNARLNSYAGARWPDPLPDVLQSLVQRSMESISEGPVHAGFRATDEACLLQLEVREFFGRVDSSETTRRVQVGMHGALTCPGYQRLVASVKTVPVADNRMSIIVAAFQQALDQCLQDLASQMASPTAASSLTSGDVERQ